MSDISQAAAKFVMWALMEGSWQGADIDGGAAQDKAVDLGLIVETVYDPKKHGESDCCDPGDVWFVPSKALLSLISSDHPPAHHRGFFESLTPEQQKAALEYDGPENHGDPAFARHPAERE